MSHVPPSQPPSQPPSGSDPNCNLTFQTNTPLPQLIYPRLIKLRKRVESQIYDKEKEVALRTSIGPIHSTHHPLDKSSSSTTSSESFHPISPGDIFSPSQAGEHDEFPWTHRWFRMDVPKLKDESERGRRFLRFMAHGEFTVYYHHDVPWCGIDPCHPRCPLPDDLHSNDNGNDNDNDNDHYSLWLDAGQWQTGFWFGLPPPDEHGFRFLSCHLQVRNEQAFQTYHDLSVLIDWIERKYKEEGGIPLKTENGYYTPLTSVPPKLRKMLRRLDHACDEYDRHGLQALHQNLVSIYASFPGPSTDPNAMTIGYVGHAHLDLVWLWPERVTYRKAVHTYATLSRLLERYPEVTFTMSQPPLYYHIAQHEPKQAQEIRNWIQNPPNRWEFTGGAEVEMDTQIPVGEGLVRSLLYGQQRISAIRPDQTPCTTLWIPDVFGYTPCLPQILSQTGIANFFTTKILWSTITQFPHNSFVWKGSDGSEVLAHLGVAGYNCHITVEEMSKAQRSYKQADVHSEILCAAGYGDGGGGLTEEHCERARRLQNLADVPSAKWTTVESFFDRLEQVRNVLPRYKGELFLEYHRGVHSTQSEFKFLLRGCERALQCREAMRVLSGMEALDPEVWLRYLFAHFHDATPGSSINSVYCDLNSELRGIMESNLAEAKEEWLVGTTVSDTDSSTFVVVNPLAWNRWCTVEIPSKHISGVQPKAISYRGGSFPIQYVDERAFASLPLQGISAHQCQIIPTDPIPSLSTSTIQASPTLLDNGIVRARFNTAGQLISLSITTPDEQEEQEDELLIETPGNFTLHNDNPAAYDAWDMDHHTIWMKRSLTENLNLCVVTTGPALAVLEGQCSIGEASHMKVKYILEHNSSALQIECEIDWKETNQTLRYEIQTSYRGEVGRFGAPFGSVDRCQSMQREREEAQWEVPASRWASVLDGRHRGLAIVTEAKYGYRVKDGCIGVTLLRSPTFPDPVADKGKHTIQFSVCAHSDEYGGFQYDNDAEEEDGGFYGQKCTAAMADELYTPPVVLEHGSSSVVPAPITFHRLNSVVPSWIVPSTSTMNGDECGGFLVRLHEVAGGLGKVRFSLAEEPKAVQLVNLKEDILETLQPLSKGSRWYQFQVPAYKIMTIRVLTKK